MKADIPEAMYERAIDDRIQDFAYRLQSQGLSMDMYMQYTGMDVNAFREGFREQAEKQVKVRLALEYVVRTDKITVSDEELEAEYKKFAEQYGMEVDQVKAAIPAAALSEDIAVEKAMKFIRSKATITTEGESAE